MRLLISAALFTLAPTLSFAHGEGGGAHKPLTMDEQPYGEPGDGKRATRTVKVTMDDTMRFQPASIRVKRGETIRFKVENHGAQLHEMVIGTPAELKEHAELMRRFPNMEHESPNMAHVAPGKAEEIVWRFTKPGEFSFACLVAGHYEAGMVGNVAVK